jgi:peptide/nickel transport system substrate-binding protein
VVRKRAMGVLAIVSSAVLAALLLAGCAPAPTADPTSAPAVEASPAAGAETAVPSETADAAPEATGEPAAVGGGRLKILYWQAVTTLNPHLASGTKDFDGAAVILEALARRNEQDQLVPFLAADIPTIENGGVAADGSSVTWTLKPGLKWSDGSDFRVEDVIFTWQYCADPATACTTAVTFENIQDIVKVDETTLTIVWKAPTADPYQAFVGSGGEVLQQAQFGACIGAATASDAACQQAGLAPIGTGAFKLRSLTPGDTVVYERNPYYRAADSVYFDEVEIKGGGDAAAAASAVCETQEFDYAWNIQLPKAALEPILAAGGCEPIAGGSLGVERIVVNFSNPSPALRELRSEPGQPHPFLTDPAVRQAIGMAIDREAIATQLYGPTGEATCNILTAPAEFVSPNLTCERDVEGAKALLEAAGWVGSPIREKDGVKLIVEFQTSINTLRQGEQAIIKSNLAEIGILVNVKAIDAAVYFSGDPGNPDTLSKFHADLQMYTNSLSTPDPTRYLDGFTCKNANGSGNSWNGLNDGDYCNPAYDTLFAQLSAELDPARRAELTIQMNDLLVTDGAVIPLVNRQTPNVKVPELQGPTWTTFDSVLWNIAVWRK